MPRLKNCLSGIISRMEYSVLKVSEIRNDNHSFRLDSEYFRKEYVEIVNLVESNKFDYLENVTSWITQGPNPIFSKTGIPCLTGRNINKGDVSYTNSDYLSEDEYKRISRYQIKEGDTLITLKGKGSIGKIGYVTDKRKAIFSRDIGIVRPDKINPAYLNIFILCKYGKKLIDRGETGGTGQSTLTTSYLKSLPIPRFEIEGSIGGLLEKIELLKQKSNNLYEDAQNLLLSELGVSDWRPKHQLSFVKNYSDVEQSERIDAEHFQPKYDELLQAIENNSEYIKLVSEIQTYNTRGLQPKYTCEGSLDVITSKRILEDGLDFENFEKTDHSNWDSQKKARIKKGDILTYTTGANIGRTAYYPLDKPALASNHVNILRIRGENPEYVAFVINSLVGRLQTEQLSAGSAQPELYPRDIDKFVIPFISKEAQNTLLGKVNESHRLRKQSKHLLECAKRAVEIAIEQDEDRAMKWLEEEVGVIGD